MPVSEAERLFSGTLSAEYKMLELICPAAAKMSLRVGEEARNLPSHIQADAEIVEIGCGTGITTRALLDARPEGAITAVDNEPAMLAQARHHLASWADEGRVRFLEKDALTALQERETGSTAIVASAYAVHNFLQEYRAKVIREIWRVLRPGGVFINGDRYALDDTPEHTALIQEEVRHYFRTLSSVNRLDVLEAWIVHLFSDESPEHIMRFTPATSQLREAGFSPVHVRFRDGVNSLIVAVKPSA